MNDTEKPASGYDPEGKKPAPAAYEVAVRLWTYQGTAAWARFSAMLLANSIVLVAVATMLAHRVMLCAIPLLPLAGFALCTCWLTIFERGAEWELHYIRKARELEGLLGGGGTRTVRDGQDFANRVQVTYADGDDSDQHRMLWVAWLRMRHAGRALIAIFFLIHGLMFIGSSLLALNTLCKALLALGTWQHYAPWGR
jgi:hypothetical protein